MKYTTLLLFAVIGTGVFAQCGMTCSLVGNTPSCNQPTFSYSVNTTGGTPPYSITMAMHAFGGLWSNVQTFPSDADGDVTGTLTFQFTDRRDQARATITDATGCVAIALSNPWQPTYMQFANLVGTLDCTTGIATVILTPTDMPSGPNNWTYAINPVGGGSGPFGTFLPDWTVVSGNPVSYRFTAGLSEGTYWVNTNHFNGGTYYYCGMSQQVTVPASASPGDCGVNFRMSAALDGALPSGSIMSDALRVGGLLPTTEPYSALGYTYTGSPANASIAPSLLAVTGNDAIVDWVVVELRSTTTTIAYSKPALLQADGDVIDTDGDAYLNVPIAAGNYYVAIRHRNHLGIMTATPRSLGVDPSLSSSLIDFRLSSTTTYGTNARVQKGTVWCLWAADATGSGTLQYTGANNDRDPILTAVGGATPNNSLTNVYDRRDVNMDGVIKYTGANNDRDPILTNVGSTTPNNTRVQQLP